MRAEPRPLALIVGSASSQRDATARSLIERGIAVVECSGLPGCILDHDDRCILRDAVQVTVLFGGRSPERFAACAAANDGPIIDAGAHPVPESIARRAAEAAQRSERRPPHARG